ncbi:glycosyltransferase [Sphingomonas sp. SFZ2018-12]|uniref:glycosyltransferase n=1 Tax=Sphingomonas sp. SFZ2018-12 TaxID=2683197 RepID=UPI001F0FC1CA|nr:glycosyltransferase [Sphingomonas sp. SFZ2018-12]MCH4894086.1 glycosyltransferase [Sphingomonas sp. SFZ2018-12]
MTIAPNLLGAVALAIWLAMLLGRDGFWLARATDRVLPPLPDTLPSVTAIVPARDEAECIGAAVASLVAQRYAGRFDILVVDDGSSDGTALLARRAAAGSPRLAVMTAAPLANGWTGKLAAMAQGVAHSATHEPSDFIWFTDADIVHAPDTLASLVARAHQDGRVLVSLMARLRCESLAERMLVPAFVFFFQLLYPFAAVSDPRRRVAGAAGGCMLVDRAALARAGGIAAIRSALIDDCALGALMKRQGPIWLGLTDRARSIRPYPGFGDIGAMIARSAYAQLGYRPLWLAGTVVGMAIVYVAPPALALFATGWAQAAGLAAWTLMALALLPMLRFYRCSPLWGLALPGIAAFYTGATLYSAWQFTRGRGGAWKGRHQAVMP